MQHFKELYVGKPKDQWFIDNLDWQPINQSQQSLLCNSFTETEVHAALLSIGNNKAPDPDGFTMEFFKKSWNTFKPDIMKVFQDFFQISIVNNNVNDTYIVIAKKERRLKATNYWLISLTISLYKIIAKTLVERLKQTLPLSISENQLAFVKNRQITDAIFMANEAINYWRMKKVKGFVIKLDIKKAFDLVGSS